MSFQAYYQQLLKSDQALKNLQTQTPDQFLTAKKGAELSGQNLGIHSTDQTRPGIFRVNLPGLRRNPTSFNHTVQLLGAKAKERLDEDTAPNATKEQIEEAKSAVATADRDKAKVGATIQSLNKEKELVIKVGTVRQVFPSSAEGEGDKVITTQKASFHRPDGSHVMTLPPEKGSFDVTEEAKGMEVQKELTIRHGDDKAEDEGVKILTPLLESLMKDMEAFKAHHMIYLQEKADGSFVIHSDWKGIKKKVKGLPKIGLKQATKIGDSIVVPLRATKKQIRKVVTLLGERTEKAISVE